VGWVIALFVIGIVLRYGSGAEALIWGILFAVMPMSGVFYPAEALPGFLQPIALALPTTHIFTAMRGLLDGRSLDWGEVAIATVGTIVMTLAALFFLTKMLELFRKRGYISRYS
jgi:ABC-2 type transport system permease protein